MVGLGTRLAIERAGTETPHLQRGAPDFYPNTLLNDLVRRRKHKLGRSLRPIRKGSKHRQRRTALSTTILG
jgi:hypothetical protein